MRFTPPLHLALLLLICISVLWARVAGTHLHVCLDACDSWPQVHLDVAAHHAEHHSEGQGHAAPHDGAHLDVDVPLFDDLLAKTPKPAQDLPLWLAVLLAFVLLLPGRLTRLRSPNGRAPPSSPDSLRPPLRGPPTLTS